MRPGPLNLITDVAGLRVGNAQSDTIRTGTTVLLGDRPFVAGVNVMGGAPGTRETDLLAPDKMVQEVDALVLSGGSAFGLDAGGGVADGLRTMGRGFAVGDQRVPIVPGAILFDLLNGGDKTWDRNPYGDLGRAALAAAETTFDLGSVGAGFGATTMDLAGGLGSASCVLDCGITVGALVAVNALGRTCDDEGRFLAQPFELASEFGGGAPGALDPALEPYGNRQPGQSTTIAIVATDAVLTQAQATRLATAAQDGMARAIQPSHTPMDGDLVFAAATGAVPLPDPIWDALRLGHAAATCLSRAIARGVHAARLQGGPLPTWTDRFGRRKTD
ncbi:P1 family peptidase [Jannaschia pohangensis]|uniref:D-aminopeptidase n=1 Tax=Jannaschia pohangensis TaxID=390807 RepID=A0A1I3UCP2_9RHOB|nr:P1 family peptidase [Jannaschia pohangensis]SFJ80675.1 D-aminopeptidase [Jannaschia pohangensis]